MRSLKKVFTAAVLMSAVLFILGAAQAATLTLPADTKVIEEEAFYGDTSLDEVVLPDQIKRIESKAFSKSSVKTVFLPDSLEFIADDAFDRDADINMTAIPGSNAYNWAVDHGFIKETDIIIPSNAGDFEYSDNDDGTCTVTKYIGTNKENIVIPKWSKDRKLVTVIGSNAFQNRNDLSGSLTIPDSITRIGYFAFDGCSGFTGNLVLPNSITVISAYAFRGCSGFTGSLILPDSLATIESGIFNQCSGFDGDLIIPDGVTAVGAFAFEGCSKLTGSLIIPDGVTVIENGAFEKCSGFNGNLKIPESVTRIESWAFFGCSGLTGELKIPNGVTIIKSRTFDGCSGFSGNLTIPDGVTIIEDCAFAGGGFTGALKIPECVTCIGDNAFHGCSGLTGSLILPDHITKIDDGTFFGCSGFTGSLIIPDSVISIGNQAFEDCSSFTGILKIPESVTSIGSYAFYRCSGFTGSLVLPNHITSINEYTFLGCGGFTGGLIIPESVTSIGISAFNGCSGLSGSLTIPNNVTSIGKFAFFGCEGFRGRLTIPSSVTSIGNDAFGYSDYLNFKKIAVQVTNDDGTTSEVLRTAVYCPRGSDAWSWAETEYEFEPVEWDGDYTSLPEESQLYGAFSDDSMVLTLGEPNKIPAGYVKSIGQDIYRVSITVAGYEMDDPVNNRYATDVFVDHHTKEVNLTDWAAFYLDTTRAPFNEPGEYTIKLWANVIEGKGELLDSMTVTVIEPEIEQYITFAEGSDFIGKGEEVTSSIQNGEIVSRIQYPLTPGMELAIPFRTDADAQEVTITLLYWNEDRKQFDTFFVDGNEIATSIAEFTTETVNKTNTLYLTLPDQDHIRTDLYVLQLSSKNSSGMVVDAQVKVKIRNAIPWIGYVQSASSYTYESETDTTIDPERYVDNVDPVKVLDVSESRYKIEMVLTSGRTDIRWVNKAVIKTTPWVNLDGFGSFSVGTGSKGLVSDSSYPVFLMSASLYDRVDIYFRGVIVGSILCPDSQEKDEHGLFHYSGNIKMNQTSGKAVLMALGLKNDIVVGRGRETIYIAEAYSGSGNEYYKYNKDFPLSVREYPENNSPTISILDGTNISVIGAYPNSTDIQYYLASFENSNGMMEIGFVPGEAVYCTYLNYINIENFSLDLGKTYLIEFNLIYVEEGQSWEDITKETSAMKIEEDEYGNKIIIDFAAPSRVYDTASITVASSNSDVLEVATDIQGNRSLIAKNDGKVMMNIGNTFVDVIVKKAQNLVQQSETFMNDCEHYGGDQGHPVNNRDQYDEMREIIRRNLGNKYDSYLDTDGGLEEYLESFEQVGCGYIALANIIIDSFIDRPSEFQSHFHFPLRNSEGFLNFDLLAIDMYSQFTSNGLGTGLNNSVVLWEFLLGSGTGLTLEVVGRLVPNVCGLLTGSGFTYVGDQYISDNGLTGKMIEINRNVARERAKRGELTIVILPNQEYHYDCEYTGEVFSQSGQHWVTITGYETTSEGNRFIISTYGTKGYIEDIERGLQCLYFAYEP